ncbi:MAG: CDP-alcohol phosphatidyltransferase family protein [Anaerolineae bacterium]|nr:CDP-alcohol phosphatidyltransferase family protein [Anaerolineae bacterium]
MIEEADGSAGQLPSPVRRSLTDLAHDLMPALFTPLAALLHRLGVTPNAVTIVGCAMSVASGTLIALGRWPVAIAVAALGGLADGIDGLLARQWEQSTPFGAFLDSVLDRWSDSAYFIGLLIYHVRVGMDVPAILAGVALSSSLLVSYTRARAEGVGARCNRGLFTRLERLGVLVAGLVFDQMTIALWVIAVLSTFTALQRIHSTWRSIAVSHEKRRGEV